ncbi:MULTISPECIES: helix-turn-helix domain-containing protein [Paenibacillus]|nr:MULTISPECIES: helix-turn-helix domain-containing protein [Paenibacillus]
MKWRWHVPTRSFLFRLIAANTIIFVLSLLILSVVNYTFTNMISEKQISETHRKLLDQTNANIEMLYERAFRVGEQLLNDKDVIKSLYALRLDPADSLVLDRKLHDAVNANDFIDSVYLYNGETENFIHSIPQDVEIFDIDPEARKLIQVRSGLGKMIFLPHRQQYVYSGKHYDNPILSLIFIPSDARSEYAIFINLKLSALQELFDKMGGSPESSFMVTNKNGILITRSDKPEAFMDAASGAEFMGKVMKSGNVSGSFVDSISGSKSLVTYAYNDKLEWYLLNATSYAYLTKGSFILQRNIIIISLLLLFACFAATILMNRKLYGPIGNVVQMVKGSHPVQATGEADGGTGDEAAYLSDVFKNLIGKVTSLEDSAVKHRERLKESRLKDILLGEPATDETMKDLHSALHGIRLHTGPMRAVAVVVESPIQREGNVADTGIRLVKDTVFELARRIFREREEMEKVDIGRHIFAILMHEPEDHPSTHRLNLLAQQAERVTGFRMKIGVGSRAVSIGELGQSFEDARGALEYSYVDHRRMVYHFDAIRASTESSSRYPVKLERSLFEAIKVNDRKEAGRILGEWFGALRRNAPADIRAALRQSVTTIETEFGTMADFTPLLRNYGKDSLYGIVQHFAELERVEAFYGELADFIIEQLKMNRHQDRAEVVGIACEFIGNHYRSSGLSAELVASELNISVPYFSKLFNEVMGVSFTQYVTDLRLHEAEQLLLATTLNVKDIGERIGFQNSSYFITVFKKKNGTSPNQFRKMNRADRVAE